MRTLPSRQGQEIPPTSCGWPNNILVIRGDDIGTEKISYYNRGMMGYQTPNIDRLGTVSQPSVKIGPSFFLKSRDAEQKVGRKWM